MENLQEQQLSLQLCIGAPMQREELSDSRNRQAAETREAQNEGQIWQRDGTGNASLKYWKACYALRRQQGKAETGEAYLMKGDPAKRLWALVPRSNMVRTFSWKAMHGERAEGGASGHAPSISQRKFAENAGAKSKATSKKGAARSRRMQTTHEGSILGQLL
jgi:hypothetical protein